MLPISKPFVSWRALFKTNQCFLQYKLGCISTFWQPIDKPKDKFIRNYAFCKNVTYIKTNFQIKKGPLQNLSARKSTLSGPHIPVPTFPLSTPPPGRSLQSTLCCSDRTLENAQASTLIRAEEIYSIRIKIWFFFTIRKALLNPGN